MSELIKNKRVRVFKNGKPTAITTSGGYSEVPSNYDKSDGKKEVAIKYMIVTISTGKRFYTDPESRIDILSAVLEGVIKGLPDEYVQAWKTPDGILDTTFAELKEASVTALVTKGGLVL